MQNATPGEMVHDLRTRVHATAAALVARDGRVLYADLPEGTYAETFGVMCATIVGASVTALRELGRAAPDHIAIEGPTSRTLVLLCAPHALLVVVAEPADDPGALLAAARTFAAAMARGSDPDRRPT